MFDRSVLKARLATLEVEHRDLDQAIQRLSEAASFDELSLKRMKKRKLALKDQITWLKDQLLPDIIA